MTWIVVFIGLEMYGAMFLALEFSEYLEKYL